MSSRGKLVVNVLSWMANGLSVRSVSRITCSQQKYPPMQMTAEAIRGAIFRLVPVRLESKPGLKRLKNKIANTIMPSNGVTYRNFCGGTKPENFLMMGEMAGVKIQIREVSPNNHFWRLKPRDVNLLLSPAFKKTEIKRTQKGRIGRM